MAESFEKSQIPKRLGEIQRTIRAPKNQFNNFGKYNYRSCEDILEAVKPILNDGEFITLSDEIVSIGGRNYVQAKAMFCLGENAHSVTAYAREPESKKGMDESQITGAASSYARKYALNGLLLIDDAKDADTMDNRNGKQSPSEKKKAPENGPKQPSGEQLKRIFAAAQEYDASITEADADKICSWFWKNNQRYGGETSGAAEFLIANFSKVFDEFIKSQRKGPA